MVAPDSMIECVNERKRADEIKAHDLVYCYDAEGKVSIGIVKTVYAYARQPQLRINWSSQGTGALGSVDVTPDTEIRLHDGGTKAAENLEDGTSVLHVHRGDDTYHNRPRIYAAGHKDMWEERIIKERWFHAPADWQLHHSTFKEDDNHITWNKQTQSYDTDLVPLSNSDHQKQHTNENLTQAEKNQAKLKSAIVEDDESSYNHWVKGLTALRGEGAMFDFDIEDVDPVKGLPTPSNYIANEICVMSEMYYEEW